MTLIPSRLSVHRNSCCQMSHSHNHDHGDCQHESHDDHDHEEGQGDNLYQYIDLANVAGLNLKEDTPISKAIKPWHLRTNEDDVSLVY